MNPVPVTVLLGMLSQREFDSANTQTPVEIEKSTRDLRQQ